MTCPAVLTILGVGGWGPLHLALSRQGDPLALQQRLQHAWQEAASVDGIAPNPARLLRGLLRSQDDLQPLTTPLAWDLPGRPRYHHRLVCGPQPQRLRLHSWELQPAAALRRRCGESLRLDTALQDRLQAPLAEGPRPPGASGAGEGLIG